VPRSGWWHLWHSLLVFGPVEVLLRRLLHHGRSGDAEGASLDESQEAITPSGVDPFKYSMATTSLLRIALPRPSAAPGLRLVLVVAGRWPTPRGVSFFGLLDERIRRFNGGNTHGDRVPIVAQCLGQCPGHGEGGQVPALPMTGGVHMNNQALIGLETLRRSPYVRHRLGPESRMPRNGARPVREGAVGFPSPEGAGRLPHNSSLETCALSYSAIPLELLTVRRFGYRRRFAFPQAIW
jgi:hypothetical protein